MLTLDPSIRSTGAALFIGPRLVAAARLIVEPEPGESRGMRAKRMQQEIIAWVVESGLRPTTLVYEWPQIYAVGKGKGDPNDVLGLLAVGAEVSGALGYLLAHTATNATLSVYTPLPSEWTCGTKKATKGDPWASTRGFRVKSRLTEIEASLIPKSHDVIDAVGIGLHQLGRFEPVRVFPGAT